MDIHNQEFKTKRNGYDRYQVDSFLDKVIDSYGDALDQIVDLKNENLKLTKKNSDLEKNLKQNTVIQTTLEDAQRQANEITQRAMEDAKKIESGAASQATSTAQDQEYQNTTLKNDYERLKAEVSEFRERLKKLLQTQIDHLDDDSWQYFLDQYYHTERIYPADGQQPIVPSSVPIDNDDSNDVNLNSENIMQDQPLAGDSPTKEMMNNQPIDVKSEDKQGPTIIFPDNYKDHN